MFLSLFLNFALAFQPTVQSACDTKDLRAFLGPVRNQGDLDWCYANAAADLIQYASESKEPVSATYLALLYNHAWEDNPIAQTGNVRHTLNEVLNHGYCTQAREDYIFRAAQKTTLKQKLRRFRDLKTAFDRSNSAEFEIIYSELSNPGSILNDLDKVEFIDMLRRSTSADVFLNFADYVCGDQNKKQIPAAKKLVFKELEAGGEALIKKAHQLLSQNQISSMSFNATFLKRDIGDLNDFIFRHASVIVGRRWNSRSNKCEILVRNSWGASCDKYSSLVTCDQANPGNLWIREDILQKTIYALTFAEGN